MSLYTVKWTCPICGASRSRLSQPDEPDDPDRLRKQTSHGLLGHVRQMADGQHGPDGYHPEEGEWTADAVLDHVQVEPFTEPSEANIATAQGTTPGFEP